MAAYHEEHATIVLARGAAYYHFPPVGHKRLVLRSVILPCLLRSINSTVNAVGLTATFSNPATNQWKVEITGGSYTGTAAGLSGSPSITVTSLTATTINGSTLSGTFAGSPTATGNWTFTGTTTLSTIIDSGIVASVSPICANGPGGAFTTSGCSGGGIGTGTQNAIAYFATTTTLGSIVCNISGQLLAGQNSGPPICSSPSLSDSGSAPISVTPYTIQCDSATTLLDRSTTLPFTSVLARSRCLYRHFRAGGWF